MAANNVVVVVDGRLHYSNTLKQEFNGTKAYEYTSADEKIVVNSHFYSIQSSEIQEFIIYKVMKYGKILMKYIVYFIFPLVKIIFFIFSLQGVYI